MEWINDILKSGKKKEVVEKTEVQCQIKEYTPMFM